VIQGCYAHRDVLSAGTCSGTKRPWDGSSRHRCNTWGGAGAGESLKILEEGVVQGTRRRRAFKEVQEMTKGKEGERLVRG
jgi:hypothetical protein